MFFEGIGSKLVYWKLQRKVLGPSERKSSRIIIDFVGQTHYVQIEFL